MSKKVKSLLRNFSAAQSGNVSIFAAFLAIPFSIAAGAALDMGRLDTANTAVQAAVDNAVLAGTQALFESTASPSAASTSALLISKNYLDDALAGNGLLMSHNITFSVNPEGTGINSAGKAKIKTSLLSFAGVADLSIDGTAGAEAEREGPVGDLEISLMLDVTGSMCDSGNSCTGGTKFGGMKTAAKELVEAVLWDDQSEFTSKIAIVPFNTHVRVGPDNVQAPNLGTSSAINKMTDLTPTWSGYYRTCTAGSGGGGGESGGNWSCSNYSTQYVNNWKLMPCVTDRFYNSTWSFDLTDNTPGPANGGRWLNANGGDRMSDSNDSRGTRATVATGNNASNPATHWNYTPDGKCWSSAEANEIVPLTDSKANLIAKIDSLVASGGTGGVLGTAFAWYMLSPKWDTIWTGQSKPQSYLRLTQLGPEGKPKLRKIAILMTDGVYNAYRGWSGQSSSFVSDNAVSMCTAMKATGIEVYAVGFELDSLSSSDKARAISTLQSCGTDIQHFYNSIDASELAAAFQDIGNKVNNVEIRLTK